MKKEQKQSNAILDSLSTNAIQNEKQVQEVLDLLILVLSNGHQQKQQLRDPQKTNQCISQSDRKKLFNKMVTKLRNTLKQKSQVYKNHILPQLLQKFFEGNEIQPRKFYGELILNSIGIDIKYESSHQPQEMIPAKATDQAVIALPYTPNQIPQQNITGLVNVGQDLRIVQNSDAIHQKHNQSRLFKEDIFIIQQYIQSLKNKEIKTIKRQGFSELFTEISDTIIQYFRKKFNKEEITEKNIQIISLICELMEYISPTVYTFPLLEITQKLICLVKNCYSSQKDSQFYSTFKKQIFEKINFSIENITERWKGQQLMLLDHNQQHKTIPEKEVLTEELNKFNKLWQWELKQIVYSRLLHSKVSKDQLYAVKSICEVCRKSNVKVNSSISFEHILSFIIQKRILQSIYRPDNHPQVILKGKQIMEYLSSNTIVSQFQIGLIFSLIEKSHDQVCKGLYLTIQALGQRNLQAHRIYIMKQILQFNRSNCIIEQTFTLIEILMLLTPMDEKHMIQSLGQLYHIMEKHYKNLKKNLKERVVNVYFELFIVGIEEGIFGNAQNQSQQITQKMINQKQADQLAVLRPVLETISNPKIMVSLPIDQIQLGFFMIQSFVQLLSRQKGKKIQNTCMKIQMQGIKKLFTECKIHQIVINYIKQCKSVHMDKKKVQQLHRTQLSLVSHLLKIYCEHMVTKSDEMIMSYQAITQMMELAEEFCEFIQYFEEEKQLQVLKKLLNDQKKIKNFGEGFDANIFIEVLKLAQNSVAEQIMPQLYRTFVLSDQQNAKEILGKIYFDHSHIQIKEFMKEFINFENSQMNDNSMLTKWSYFILLKMHVEQLSHYLASKKQKSQSMHAPSLLSIPFQNFGKSYSAKIKMIDSFDLLIPIEYKFTMNNNNTIKDMISKILTMCPNRLISQLKIHFVDKYVSLDDFDNTIDQFIRGCSKHVQKDEQLLLVLYESRGNQWFDKCQLLKDGTLHPDVNESLKQIFKQYSKGTNKLNKEQCAKLFQKATNTEKILITDNRITHIFNQYSDSGQFFTLSQWLHFYLESSSTSPGLVVQNLRNLGYDHLFKSPGFMNTDNKPNITEKQENEQSLLEILQSQLKKHSNVNIYDLLLKEQKYDSAYSDFVEVKSIQVLKSLPVNKNILEEIIKGSISLENSLKSSWYISKLICYLLNLNDKSNNQENHELMMLFNQRYKKEQQCTETQAYSCWVQDISCSQKVYNYLISSILMAIQNLKVCTSNKIRELYFEVLSHSLYIIRKSIKCRDFVKLTDAQVQSIRTLPQKTTFETKTWSIIDDLMPTFFYSHILKDQQQKQLSKISSQKQVEILQHALIMILSNAQPKSEIGEQNSISINVENIFNPISQKLRKIWNNFYYIISDIFPSIKAKYYQMLTLKQIEGVSSKQAAIFSNFPDEYYDTLTKFLIEENQADVVMKIQQILVQSIISKQQKILADCLSNKVLVGKLQLLNTIALLNPSFTIKMQQIALIEQLCQQKSARVIFHSLVDKIETCNKNKLRKISKILSNHDPENMIKKNSQIKLPAINEIVLHKKGHHHFTNTIRPTYMGLYNLGCICYINATLQQLFMINSFKKIIMESQRCIFQQKQEEIHHNYFDSLQQIMYELQYGQRCFFIPENFCKNFLDYAGQPVNVKQQHDADQFLNHLLTKLQKTLSKENIKSEQPVKAIHSMLRGQTLNTIQCQQCLYKKTKVEEFYVLTLQIKEMKNIQQCLNKWIEPEIICDYQCEHCDKKVQMIHKYNRLKSTPNFFVIHLQRLVFDLELFTKIKLDHMIEFDEEINLKDYFANENIEQGQQSYLYTLKGFIVHVGTSQSGHYYSFIKESDSGRWMKFDDSRVQKTAWQFHDAQNIYMLIYEKKTKKEALSKIVPHQKMLAKVMKDNQQLKNQNQLLDGQFCDYLVNTIKNLTTLDKSILQIHSNALQYEKKFENLFNSPSNSLFDPFNQNYITFEKQYNETWNNYGQALQNIRNYVQILGSAKNVGLGIKFIQGKKKAEEPGNNIYISIHKFKQLICYYITFLHIAPRFAHRELQNIIIKCDGLKILLNHSQPLIRQSYKLILIKLLSISLWAAEQSPPNKMGINPLIVQIPKQSIIIQQQATLEKSYDWISPIKQILLRLLNCFQVEQQLGRNPQRTQQLFDLLTNILLVSRICRQWFIVHHIGPKIIHFMLQALYGRDESYLSSLIKWGTGVAGGSLKQQNQKYKEGYKWVGAGWKTLEALLQTNGIQNIQLYAYLKKLNLYQQTFCNSKLYKNLIHFIPIENFNSICKFLRFFCSCYQELSQNSLLDQLCQFFISSINRCSHDDYYSSYRYFRLLQAFLEGIQSNNNTKKSKQIIQKLMGVPLLAITTKPIKVFQDILQKEKVVYEISLSDFKHIQQKLNEKNKQQANIESKQQNLPARINDRVITYISNYERQSDQYYLPILQLIYLARKQYTYFSMIGVLCILRACKMSKIVLQHILQMPQSDVELDNSTDTYEIAIAKKYEDPSYIVQYVLQNCYLSFIGKFIKQALSGGKIKPPKLQEQLNFNTKNNEKLTKINENELINEIAQYLSDIENVSLNIDENDKQKAEQIANLCNILNTYNQCNLSLKKARVLLKSEHYVIQFEKNITQDIQQYFWSSKQSSQMKDLQMIDEKQNSIEIKVQQIVISGQEINKIQLSSLEKQTKIKRFTILMKPYSLVNCKINNQWNSQERIYDNRNGYYDKNQRITKEIFLPVFEQSKQMTIEITVLFSQKPARNEQTQNLTEKMQEQKDFPSIDQQYGNKQNNDANIQENMNENFFECPFCGIISNVFTSKCGTCGEDWGQMF